MNKEIYLVSGTNTETYPEFRERMLFTAEEVNSINQPEKLWITLTESPPPAISIIPFKQGKIASFTLFRQEGDTVPCSLLTGQAGFRFASQVEEGIPIAYTKDWPDGSVTPGVCLLTLFRSRKDLSHDIFIDRWHNSHTPLSLRIHPLWHYNRNVVTQTIASNEPAWDGIVEEHFKTRTDLLNPFRFFGNPMVIIPRMIEVYRDTNAFLDYKTIEPWLVREYHIR